MKKIKLGETKFGEGIGEDKKTGKAEFVDYDVVGKTKFIPPKTG